MSTLQNTKIFYAEFVVSQAPVHAMAPRRKHTKV